MRSPRFALAVFCAVIVASGAFSVEAVAGTGVWTTGGPDGGSIKAIAVDPNNSAILYVGTLGGGIFKSTNHGLTWTPVNTGLRFMNVLCLVSARAFLFGPTVLYAGTFLGGVYRSTNGGATWVPVNTGLTSLTVQSLAIDPNNTSTVYAGTFLDVFVTKNGGATWTATTTFGPYTALGLTTHPVLPDTVFAGTLGGGIFVTVNGGATWTPITCGLTSSVGYAFVIPKTFPWPVYAGTGGGLFVWRPSPLMPPFSPCFTRFTALPPQPFQALAGDPNNSQILYAANDVTVYVTTNGGATWSALGGPFATRVDALAADPQFGFGYAGTRGSGFYRNSNAIWIEQNRGLTAHDTNAVAVAASHPNVLYAATADDGVYKSVNGGVSWTSVLSNLPIRSTISAAVDPTNPDVVYAGLGDTQGLYKSTNGGGSWSLSIVGATFAIAIDPTNPSTIYAGSSVGMVKSTNGGTSWSAINSGLSAFALVKAIAIDPQVPSTVYAGGNFGVAKSTNGGASWTPAVSGPPSTSVTSLTIRPDHPNILYAGTDGGGVFHSDTGGLVWSATNTGLTNLVIYGLVVDPAHPDTIYAGTSGDGIWVSVNTGASWSSFNTGSPNPFVKGLAISPAGTAVHAATSGSVYDIRSSGKGPPGS